MRQPQESAVVETLLETIVGILLSLWTQIVSGNNHVYVIDFNAVLEELNGVPDDLEIPIPAVLKLRHQHRLTAYHNKIQYQVKRSGENRDNISNNTKRSENKHFEQEKQLLEFSEKHEGVDSSTDDTELQPLGLEPKISKMGQSAKLKARQRRQRKILDFITAIADERNKIRDEIGLDVRNREENKLFKWAETQVHPKSGSWPALSIETLAQISLDSTNSEKKRTTQKNRITKNEEIKGKNNAASLSEAQNMYAARVLHAAEAWGVLNKRALKVDQNNPCNKSPMYSPNNTLVSDMETYTSSEEFESMSAELENRPHVDDSRQADKLPSLERGSSIDEIDFELLRSMLYPEVVSMIQDEVLDEYKTAANRNKLPKDKDSSEGEGMEQPKESISSKISDPTNHDKEIENVSPTTPPTSQQDTNNNTSEQSASDRINDINDKTPSVLSGLASIGIALPCPVDVKLSDFIGAHSFSNSSLREFDQFDDKVIVVSKVKSGGKSANMTLQRTEPLLPYPELSMAQVRQLVALQLILPLVAQPTSTNENIKSTNNYLFMEEDSAFQIRSRPLTVLLYGPEGTGKTLLAKAVAGEASAAFFDLTPSKILENFEGDDIGSTITSVFHQAKVSAPSVIYIDQVHTVFIQDPFRAAEQSLPGRDPPNRMMKELVNEVANLKPSDGVLVIGCSRSPHSCMSTDETNLINFFQLIIKIPLPDSLSRRSIVKAYIDKSKYFSKTFNGCNKKMYYDNDKSEFLSKASFHSAGRSAGNLENALEETFTNLKAAEIQSSDNMSSIPAQSKASDARTLEQPTENYNPQKDSNKIWLSMFPIFVDEINKVAKMEKEEVKELREWTARAQAMKKQVEVTRAKSNGPKRESRRRR